VEQQVGEFAALLHEMNFGKSPDALGEIFHADQFAEDKSGIVEAESLIEITDKEVVGSLHVNFSLIRKRLSLLIHWMQRRWTGFRISSKPL
jgi:hypothetical protein